MKALFELFRRFDARRIFGFIRRLGGMSRPKVKCYDLRSTHALRVKATQPCSAPAFLSRFLSTLFGWRAICCPPKRTVFHQDFYPRPPGGGRPSSAISNILSGVFLSTPSGWRATRSILSGSKVSVFLSTPSGWRATKTVKQLFIHSVISIHALRVEGDRTPRRL